MSYGQEIRFDQLGLGLAQHFGENKLPPGAALVETNFDFDEVGGLRKRNGFVRQIPEIFSSQVRAIIPIEDCFGVRQFMIAETDLRVAQV